ncbi:hypothetical protein HU200_042979 [Digitaria exilis]|uniref:BTB domain-containing protein n=1 Tax=Digitaria exilis TaxID=1010633 RepID=A0A835B517_9POAL|nr:hypothetical protein HU200_042979 [Digitaria exilis]CAB3471119.1 unnamed protein product [Digitaria exilis]
MEPAGCVDLTGTVSSVHLLKINGYHFTATMTQAEYIKALWDFDGHAWEVRCYPQHPDSAGFSWVALKLILLGEAQAHPPRKVRATLSCRLVDPTGKIGASEEKSKTSAFSRPQDCSSPILLVRRDDTKLSAYLNNDSVTIQCTITMFKELDVVIPAPVKEQEGPLPIVPPSDLHQHLGELFLSQNGADVTFVVGGESFPAHKSILAARSPIFEVVFFGSIKEGNSWRVEDMEADVFRAVLRFIYTDDVPAAELDESSMAEHLLAAADRYGLDRLKVICERKLYAGINVDTVAATLALAKQHDCSVLKARCVEFIVGSAERFGAVMATEGYKHLAARYPLVLVELVKAAARGRKN